MALCIFHGLQVDGMNCLISELADVAAQERAMLDECEALLATTAAMQVRTITKMLGFTSSHVENHISFVLIILFSYCYLS